MPFKIKENNFMCKSQFLDLIFILSTLMSQAMRYTVPVIYPSFALWTDWFPLLSSRNDPDNLLNLRNIKVTLALSLHWNSILIVGSKNWSTSISYIRCGLLTFGDMFARWPMDQEEMKHSCQRYYHHFFSS